MVLSPGARLGPYEILALLAVPALGEVYLAKDVRVAREVALKVFSQDVLGNEGRLELEREARIHEMLDHPAIAAVYSLEEIPGHPSSPRLVLAMELVEGEDLGRRLRRGPLPVREALAIARDIAAALEAAHAKGIVHAALRPGNVIVTPEGRGKLVDFRFARSSEESVSSPHSSDRLLLSAGSPAYLSPETLRTLRVDVRSDLWALGVMILEMLTGRNPFRAETILETLAAVLRAPVNFELLPGATPQPARDLLARCLERDPERRLADSSEARRLLDEAASGSGREPQPD